MTPTNGKTNDFKRFYGRLHIKGELELVTPLRIGSGNSTALADIAVVKDSRGNPYIPGSSFKGILRSHIESFMRTIDKDNNRNLACLCVTFEDHDDSPPGSKSHCPTTLRPDALKARVDYLKKQADKPKDNDAPYLDRIYLSETCFVCRVFGSNGLAAKVTIPDIKLNKSELSADEMWHGRYQIRHGVSIDRDTETAAEGRLYTGEAVPSGSRFDCEIIIENGSAADQGLVLLGLRAFEQGRVTLGGAASRGLGQVRLTITGCQEVSDEPAALIDYLVSGEGSPVDEAGRLNKITSLREELGV